MKRALSSESSSSSGASSDNDYLDTAFEKMMADHRCDSSVKENNHSLDEKRVAREQSVSRNKAWKGSQTEIKKPDNRTSINKNSKKHFEQQKHSYEEVVIGKRVAIPRFYSELYERKRLYHVIEDVTEIIWVDVRSSLGIDNKESVWWPGRVLTDEERNLFKTTHQQDVLLNKKTNVLVELFGFRDEHFRYHPIVVNRGVIRSLFDPEVNRDAAAFIGDPNRRLEDKETMIRYFNNGLGLLDRLCQERNYTKETTVSILQMEGDSVINETPTEVDSSYGQRLAKNIVEIEERHEDREALHAGELIGYYYKPFGPVGDKRAYFETHILEIYEYNGRTMMKLENNHVLTEDTQVKRIRDQNGTLIESMDEQGQYKCLGEYDMAFTRVCSDVKEKMNDLEKLKTALSDIRTFYNKKVSELENNELYLV